MKSLALPIGKRSGRKLSTGLRSSQTGRPPAEKQAIYPEKTASISDIVECQSDLLGKLWTKWPEWRFLWHICATLRKCLFSPSTHLRLYGPVQLANLSMLPVDGMDHLPQRHEWRRHGGGSVENLWFVVHCV